MTWGELVKLVNEAAEKADVNADDLDINYIDISATEIHAGVQACADGIDNELTIN